MNIKKKKKINSDILKENQLSTKNIIIIPQEEKRKTNLITMEII